MMKIDQVSLEQVPSHNMSIKGAKQQSGKNSYGSSCAKIPTETRAYMIKESEYAPRMFDDPLNLSNASSIMLQSDRSERAQIQAAQTQPKASV